MICALLAGCAQFPDEHPAQWEDQPSLEAQAGPEPSIEGQSPPPPSGSPRPQEPQQPVGCTDPDPAVVATCLAPVGAIAVLPDGQSALVAERSTGRILQVQPNAEPVEIAQVPVDAAGGGITGLALSPSYHEDELIYAYVTTTSGTEDTDELRHELIQWVRKEIGPIATPDVLQFAPSLPKTRSGKIMRRILARSPRTTPKTSATPAPWRTPAWWRTCWRTGRTSSAPPAP